MRPSILAFLLFICSNARAIQTQSWYFGPSYYSQNSLYKTTTSDSGKSNILGTAFYFLPPEYLWISIALGGFMTLGWLHLRHSDHLLH